MIFGSPNIWFRMAPFFVAGMLLFLYRDRGPRLPALAAGGAGAFVACAWALP